MAILRKTEKAMSLLFQLNSLQKGVAKKLPVGLLGLKETLIRLANANEVRWCGHVLRRDSDMLRRALGFEMVGKREHG